MIPESSHPHRAKVDANGNIILPGSFAAHETSIEPVHVKEEKTMVEGVWYKAEPVSSQSFAWEATEEDFDATAAQMRQEEVVEVQKVEPAIVEPVPAVIWSEVRERLYDVTNTVVSESVRQFSVSMIDGKSTIRKSMQSLHGGMRWTWNFVRQPVWVPGRNNQPKQYGRGALFALDVVRFGGTFASLFIVLFAGLNYQSFWAIAKSYVDPLAQVTHASDSANIDQDLAEKLKKIPSLTTAGEEDSGLIDVLPPVGPPENRIIIPSLNLNVPIAVPSNDALLREDWKKLEEDIQTALQDGVVHYPGTARPGQAGNFFVTGHSSYFPWAKGDYKSVFARLHELKVGDEYWIFYGGDKHRYIIQEKKEIKPSDVTVLDQPTGKRISTLMTCTPVGTTLRRLIVVAQEVDPVTGLALDVGEHQKREEMPKVRMEVLPI